MTTEPDSFKRATVEALAKRAANRCSNPDCGAITSGPAEDPSSSVTLGEAAHIYGARPLSARYDATMAPGERSSITNGIWLCRNCHKIIDTDSLRFPAPVLFEWRAAHEASILDQLGKAGDRIRAKIAEDDVRLFEGESYMARQIVRDKPDHWEYRLTAELLRSKLKPITARWKALDRRLYAKKIERISSSEAVDWFQDRLSEIGRLVEALAEIINREFQSAWGPAGEPGSSEDILAAADLFEEACIQLHAWEETVRFTEVPDDFAEIRDLFAGVGGRVMEQVAGIPQGLAEVFESDRPSGVHHIRVEIDLPPEWPENVGAAFSRIVQRLR